jgi:hypothetical protein
MEIRHGLTAQVPFLPLVVRVVQELAAQQMVQGEPGVELVQVALETLWDLVVMVLLEMGQADLQEEQEEEQPVPAQTAAMVPMAQEVQEILELLVSLELELQDLVMITMVRLEFHTEAVGVGPREPPTLEQIAMEVLVLRVMC